MHTYIRVPSPFTERWERDTFPSSRRLCVELVWRADAAEGGAKGGEGGKQPRVRVVAAQHLLWGRDHGAVRQGIRTREHREGESLNAPARPTSSSLT